VPTPNLPSLSELQSWCALASHRRCRSHEIHAAYSFSFAAAIFFGWIIRRIINTSRGRRARECSGAARRRLVPLKLFRALVARVSLFGEICRSSLCHDFNYARTSCPKATTARNCERDSLSSLIDFKLCSRYIQLPSFHNNIDAPASCL
jgi:hypothetical protein